MKFYDKSTGAFISDSACDPLKDADASIEALNEALSHYILSVSGWRSVFSAEGDEGRGGDISPEDRILAAAAASAELEGVGEKSVEPVSAADSAVAPPDFTEPYAPRAEGGSFWSWLERVPGWAGAVWDVVVLGVAALCVVGCVMGVVQPTPENAKWPTWYLWMSYLVFLMPMLLIACYLLLDRRPVRRAVPALACLSVRQETRVGLLALIAIFVAWVLTSAAAGM